MMCRCIQAQRAFTAREDILNRRSGRWDHFYNSTTFVDLSKPDLVAVCPMRKVWEIASTRGTYRLHWFTTV